MTLRAAENRSMTMGSRAGPPWLAARGKKKPPPVLDGTGGGFNARGCGAPRGVNASPWPGLPACTGHSAKAAALAVQRSNAAATTYQRRQGRTRSALGRCVLDVCGGSLVGLRFDKRL